LVVVGVATQVVGEAQEASPQAGLRLARRASSVQVEQADLVAGTHATVTFSPVAVGQTDPFRPTRVAQGLVAAPRLATTAQQTSTDNLPEAVAQQAVMPEPLASAQAAVVVLHLREARAAQVVLGFLAVEAVVPRHQRELKQVVLVVRATQVVGEVVVSPHREPEPAEQAETAFHF
jgi:hypothetical protein